MRSRSTIRFVTTVCYGDCAEFTLVSLCMVLTLRYVAFYSCIFQHNVHLTSVLLYTDFCKKSDCANDKHNRIYIILFTFSHIAIDCEIMLAYLF